MTEKFVPPDIVAQCVVCGAKNSMYINRQSGKFYCNDCFNKMFSCWKCHRIAIHGLKSEKLWWCWDCFLKDYYGIVRRKPKTESDFKKIREMSQPIWKKEGIKRLGSIVKKYGEKN